MSDAVKAVVKGMSLQSEIIELLLKALAHSEPNIKQQYLVNQAEVKMKEFETLADIEIKNHISKN